MTIQLFNSLVDMTSLLRISTNINKFILPFVIFSNNFVLKHSDYNIKFRNSVEYHNIKCWKSNCILNYHIEDEDDNNRIFKLDFTINNDNNNDNNDSFIKIDYLDINNDFYNRKYNYYYKSNSLLTNDEVKMVRMSLIKFVENWGIKKNINKIIIDIHSNLERYNEEFKDLGFNITENKCLLNPYWFIAEKQLK
jgi:hypothetical protein